MNFSEKLFELRKQRGLSQEQLANKVEVSRQTLSKWELGESTPDMDKLILLSDYFDVSLDELVLGKEKEIKEQNTENMKSVGQVLDEKVFTKDNAAKIKKGFKIAEIVILTILGIDFAVFIVYVVLFGFPK